MHLQIASTYIYNGYMKFFYFWILESHVLSHFTGAILQDDITTNFQIQRLGP